MREIIFFEETREEGLGEVLRIVRRKAFAAHVSVKRIPIFAAEIFERSRAPDVIGTGLGGLKHLGPTCGEKDLLPGIYGFRHWLNKDLM